jgi:hypothetical protein
MAVYNSSSISRGDPPRSGIYGVSVVGTINLGNVTLTSGDTLPVCKIPFGCFIKSTLFNFPILNPSGTTLAISLLDTLSSPTTYINASTSGSNFSALTTLSTGNFLNAVFGTQYGSTARAVGSSGSAVVVWTSGVQLNLSVTATATAATGGTMNITYMVEFAPAYDMGT